MASNPAAPAAGPGKPRLNDRLMLSGIFYAEACKCSLDSLPAGMATREA
jgi:hypothetical protein